MHLLFTFACALLFLVTLVFIVSKVRTHVDKFTDPIAVIANMAETPDRRSQFASSLLRYDPRMMKYQDPRNYDFHTCGFATQKWKAEFNTFISKVGDEVVQKVMTFDKMIVLFDGPQLVGNIIFVPIADSMPSEIDDQIVFRRYIKWAPPANSISAIVPAGYKIKVLFAVDGLPGVTEVKYIEEGITPSFTIAQPLLSMTVVKT
jgi:hypothetical protein